MKSIWETASKLLAVTGVAVLMYSASTPQRAEAWHTPGICEVGGPAGTCYQGACWIGDTCNGIPVVTLPAGTVGCCIKKPKPIIIGGGV